VWCFVSENFFLCARKHVKWLLLDINKYKERSVIKPIFTRNFFHCHHYSRRMRWAGHVARMGEGRGVYRVLVGKPEGKRPLGIPRRRWEGNIKMDLQERGCGWCGLGRDR
jgi:hypothetical protein